jgi:hypothetical protein
MNYTTERLQLVGEVSANFCEYKLLRGHCDGFLQPYSRIHRPEPLLFISSSSSIVLTRLSGPYSKRHYFSEKLIAPGNEPGPLDLYPGTLTTRLKRQS